MSDETKHSPEPWDVSDQTGRVYAADRSLVAQVFDGPLCAGNERRLRACVNACAGLPTAALEAGALAVLVAAARAWDRIGDPDGVPLENAREAVDALARAVRAIGRSP